ncbi:multipolar spindle 1 [Wolffia australiana]
MAAAESLKMAIAVAFALSRTKRLAEEPAAVSSSPADADADRWKKKAKERKRELISLREEVKRLEAERERGSDDVMQIVSCRCQFFDESGVFGPRKPSSGAEGEGEWESCGNDWIDDALRRRFFRHIRWRKRQRKVEGSTCNRSCAGLDDGDEIGWLCISVDFLLELSSSKVSENDANNFAALSHLATDSILASLRKLMASKNKDPLVEDVVNRLLTCLLQRMWPAIEKFGTGTPVANKVVDIHVQHLIRILGGDPYMGQWALFLVSQKISCVADTLLITDPFDDVYPNMHDYMYMMMQLTESILQDNLHEWTKKSTLDSKLFEEWLRSTLKAREAMGALENRNGLYLIYLDRIIGSTAKQLQLLSDQQSIINTDLLDALLCI